MHPSGNRMVKLAENVFRITDWKWSVRGRERERDMIGEKKIYRGVLRTEICKYVDVDMQICRGYDVCLELWLAISLYWWSRIRPAQIQAQVRGWIFRAMASYFSILFYCCCHVPLLLVL